MVEGWRSLKMRQSTAPPASQCWKLRSCAQLMPGPSCGQRGGARVRSVRCCRLPGRLPSGLRHSHSMQYIPAPHLADAAMHSIPGCKVGGRPAAPHRPLTGAARNHRVEQANTASACHPKLALTGAAMNHQTIGRAFMISACIASKAWQQRFLLPAPPRTTGENRQMLHTGAACMPPCIWLTGAAMNHQSSRLQRAMQAKHGSSTSPHRRRHASQGRTGQHCTLHAAQS